MIVKDIPMNSLSVSSLSFTIIAVVYILIGTAGLIIIGKYGSGNFNGQFFFGKQVDELIFQRSSVALNQEMPAFGKYISRLMMVFSSFMVGMGILQFGVARYGFAAGPQWAFWVSVLSNALMLFVYWVIIVIPVIREFNVSYFSFWHPYAFIPTLLLPVAIITGAIGLYGR